MSNTAINSLAYAGTVKLSLHVGDKKILTKTIHNAGTYRIFNFFSECLVGNFDVAKLLRPTKIMLITHNKEESVDYAASYFINMVTAPEKVYDASTQGETVRYSFIIPRAVLDTAKNIAAFNRIGLYPATATQVEEYSAYCDITSDDPLDQPLWDSSSVLTLDWELNISNAAVRQ